VGTDADLRLVLLASPLLGPAVWAPVAERLEAHGWDVLVPSRYDEVTSPEDVLDRLAADLPPNDPLLLVPHSNAGLYVAAIAAARDVRGVVFVDAGLPADAATTPTAPPSFREFLGALADEEGLLPVWTHWWPPEEVGELFPDRRLQALVEAEQVRLPLVYFDAEVPSPPGWEQLPAAYLAFGDAYANEAARAARAGWPVETLAGRHLHLLADPVGVSGALEGLLGRLGFQPSR
jgi:hypothetical protein